jgi:hypothetical protein
MNISTMKKVGIALLLVGSLLFVTLPVYADEATGGLDEAFQANDEVMAEIEANKAAFAQELAARWESEALARGNDETWLGRISGALSEEDAETLLSKSDAESYDEFIGTQTTSELVFYPLKPCRVVDTRFATRWGSYGTPVGSGGTIAVRTYPSLAGQGGASDCGVYSGSAAVVVNVTAVPVSGGQGFLTVWPYGQSRPNASLVNYNSASTSGAIANAVSQSQCRGCSDELYVYASRTSHVIIDVIGYFAQNTATALQTYHVSAHMFLAQTMQIAPHWVLSVLLVIRLPEAVLNGNCLHQRQITCTTLHGRATDGAANLGTQVEVPNSLDVTQCVLGHLAADDN